MAYKNTLVTTVCDNNMLSVVMQPISRLSDCAKAKVQKSLVETLNRYKKQEEERKSQSFLENYQEKY